MGSHYLKPEGHLTCSGILECMKRCGKYKGCCMGCPGRKGSLVCAVDLEEEIILWFEAYDAKRVRNNEGSRRRREKRKEG